MEDEILKHCFLIDFGGIYENQLEKFKYYKDLSPSGNYKEAIGVLYDVLRSAELKEDCKLVLVTEFVKLEGKLV